MTEHLTSEMFVRWLRQALHHLYDPPRLRQNPLMGLLVGDRLASPLTLQGLLIAAIEALQPARGVSPQSDAARTYRVLLHRYVEQFTQDEVADDLGIGGRQLRRQEIIALEALANYLAQRYRVPLSGPPVASQIAEPAAREPEPSQRPVEAAGKAGPEEGLSGGREAELAWLGRSFSSEPADLRELVASALKVLEPLRQTLGVRVACAGPEGLPCVTVQVAPMRQALLIVLTEALRSAPGGQVRVEVAAKSDQVAVIVRPIAATQDAAPAFGNHAERLQVACELAALSQGALEITSGGAGSPWIATLSLPCAGQVTVLFVDDNADTLGLFQRYLAGTRYLFKGVREPAQALALAQAPVPQIIVADLMLPGMDGWELLGNLQAHPCTAGVPVIVCSILPQEQLALALGAAGFLRKPVTREVLLAALDQQMVAMGRGSH
jgi:CheY-like chemotaxis protein